MELKSPSCMGFLIRKLINVLFGLQKGDYTLMKQQIIDNNWEKLINDELDVNNAC
jgi:predicted transcriptional regulator